MAYAYPNFNAALFLSLLSVVSMGCGGAQQPPAAMSGAPQPGTETNTVEYERVKHRFEEPRYQAMLASTCSAAVQAGEKGVDELMTKLFIDMKGSGSFNFDASVKGAGGIDQYKARLAAFLTHDDVMARGTAALALAVVGDLRYVEPLATLLRSRGLPAHAEPLEGYDRGMAMMALGVLRATDYRAEIEAFKSSKLQNESGGAQAALELMDRKGDD